MNAASKARLVGARQAQLVAVVAVMGAVAQSPAQTAGESSDRYRLHWVRESGAESCVSGAVLARLLPQVVVAGAGEAGAPVLLLEGVAESAAAPLSFRVRISVRDAASGELLGERELTTAESKCSALTPAVMLVLAMSVDPDAAQGGLPASVQDELRRGREEDVDVWPATGMAAPTARAPRKIQPPAPTRPAPLLAGASAAPPSNGSTAELRGGLALSYDVQPKLAPGLMLGGRLVWSKGWSASLAGFGWLPRTVSVVPSPYALDDGVDFNAVQLVLSLCRRLVEWGPAQAEACAGADIGVRWLMATALANQDNPLRAFYGPELGLAGSLQLGGGWSIHTSIDAALSLRDDRFTYTDHTDRQQVLFDPGLFSGRALLGVGRQL